MRISSPAPRLPRFLRSADGRRDAAPGLVRLPVPRDDPRVRLLRVASTGVAVIAACGWHVRTTGQAVPTALALLAVVVLTLASSGKWLTGALHRLVPVSPGVAFEFLIGFFLCNTALFAMTLISPLGIAWNAALVAGCLLLFGGWAHAAARPVGRSVRAEAASFVTLLTAAVFATLWVTDQQPIVAVRDEDAIYSAWFDLFIHVREISAFAQSHGLSTLFDIKLSGVRAPVYHFASYMLPALVTSVGATSAMDAYAAVMLPFGLLLMGAAAYSLVTVCTRTTWPAVVAAVVLLSFPDAYQQGFGIHYLSFAFMSQVNLGMLYGIACISLAWLFMIEGCRTGLRAGVVLSFLFLALCATYKAHLFVANALVLMLYPCLFFGRHRLPVRLVAAVVATGLFMAVVHLSQQLPRVPTLRLDGSGLADYVDILMGGFADGFLKQSFTAVYYGHRWPHVVNAALAASLIVLASFGVWTVVGPLVLWRGRRSIASRTLVFIALVVGNYLAMSTLLALDERGIGSREEFVNRPHAWAYFVVVCFTAASLAHQFVPRGTRLVPRRTLALCLVVLSVASLGVSTFARDLQTLPEWSGYGAYADFNSQPACLIRAALSIRDNAAPRDVVLDSALDARLAISAISERQTYVADAGFGGHADVVAERLAEVRPLLAAHDADALRGWAAAHRVTWLLLHADDAPGWSSRFLEQAVFRCEDYRVFRIGG